jgi:hypothetical protein
VKTMPATIIYDVCPYDCRLPVNLPNEVSSKNVKITIEVVEPDQVPAEKPVPEVAKDVVAKVK